MQDPRLLLLCMVRWDVLWKGKCVYLLDALILEHLLLSLLSLSAPSLFHVTMAPMRHYEHFVCTCYSGDYTIYSGDNFEMSPYYFFYFLVFFPTPGPPTKVNVVFRKCGQTLKEIKMHSTESISTFGFLPNNLFFSIPQAVVGS